jgi:outer membrane protein TolC
VQEAVDLALKNSPVIRGAQAEIDMAQAQVAAAKAGFKPALSATTFATTGSESGSIYGTPGAVMPQNLYAVPRGPFANQNFMLMWPLAAGGRLQALLRQAQAANAASAADFEAVQLDLALEVKTAYRQALLAKEMTAVAEQRQKATAERVKNDTAAAQAGRVPQLYVLRDQAEDADAQQELTNAQRDADLALVMLRAAIGVDQNSQVTLSDSLDAPAVPAPENSLELALKQRPELKAAQNRLKNARHGVDAARSASRPQIALSAMADANRMRGGSGVGGGASAGLVLGVPIFDGGIRRSERETSAAALAKAQAELDRVRLQIEREVQSAQLTLTAAGKNVTTAQTAIAAAEEEYRVAALRYDGGRGTNVEVLDALAALTRARGNKAKAQYEISVAADQLNRALGMS